jgi:hypothetical protein
VQGQCASGQRTKNGHQAHSSHDAGSWRGFRLAVTTLGAWHREQCTTVSRHFRWLGHCSACDPESAPWLWEPADPLEAHSARECRCPFRRDIRPQLSHAHGRHSQLVAEEAQSELQAHGTQTTPYARTDEAVVSRETTSAGERAARFGPPRARHPVGSSLSGGMTRRPYPMPIDTRASPDAPELGMEQFLGCHFVEFLSPRPFSP